MGFADLEEISNVSKKKIVRIFTFDQNPWEKFLSKIPHNLARSCLFKEVLKP